MGSAYETITVRAIRGLEKELCIKVCFRQGYCLVWNIPWLPVQYTIYFQHTVAKTYADPNIPEGVIELNMFSHLTMGSPERPAVATVAPHPHRYTTEVYRPRERVIHAFLNASISTNILTRLHLVVNSQEPFLTYHSRVWYALNDLGLSTWSLLS